MGEFSRWSVAWICSLIYFLLLGVARLSGLLYLAAIGRYNADRSQAALPFVLCYTVRNVAGPLIGYMGRKVEIRLLTACGCFISALGAGACFFAEDITTVSVLWGGVFGLGFGLGSILLPEILNQHFDKYISNANGIALGGECVAGFVLPIFVEFLLDTYGASGTFLILSGLILHGVPAALLLKPPSKASIHQPESSRNAVGGKYLAVAHISDEDCKRGDVSDTRAIKCSDESVLDDCNRTDYQMKAESDNSEVLEHSESYSVTDPLVQRSHATSPREDFVGSKTATRKIKRPGYSIASESNRPPTSQITTNHWNCDHFHATNTSNSHFKDYSCSRNCANLTRQTRISPGKQLASVIVSSDTQYDEVSSNYLNDIQPTVHTTADNNSDSTHPTRISPEKQLRDRSRLHCRTSNHRSLISSDIQSDEVPPNHFSDIHPTVHATSDCNHSNNTVSPQVHSTTFSGSPPCTESTNNPEESTNHPKESTNDPTEFPNNPIESPNNPIESPGHPLPLGVFLDPTFTVTPHTHSIATPGSSPCTESTNNRIESTNNPTKSTNNPTKSSNNPTKSSNNPTESANNLIESSGSPFCVFLDPAFLLILFTQSSMIFIFTTIMTIIVDFSRDAGVKAHQEVYILMCLSVSDMMGRFGLGWVTDAHYMGNVTFSALCYAGTGFLMVSLVFLKGFTMVMVVAFFIGLFLGGLLIVCPGIVLDFIEKEEVTMALASRFVLYAPMSLTQSLLIGFFREKMGSYNGLFYVLAVHSFLCCAFSLSVPLASRYRVRRKETKRLQATDNSCHNMNNR